MRVLKPCVQCAEYGLLNVILIQYHYNAIIIETNVFTRFPHCLMIIIHAYCRWFLIPLIISIICHVSNDGMET